MSVQVMSWVLEHSETTLASRLVLLSIANHASHEGESCWPSIKTISRESRVSERQVVRCVKRAEVLGELKVNRFGGRGRSNTYGFPKYAKLSPFKISEKVTDDTEKVTFDAKKVVRMSPEPSLTILKEEPSKDMLFERFYDSYPRKIAKKAALRAWKAIHPTNGTVQSIMHGLEAWQSYWRGKDRQFIPYPATWLNQERWKEAPDDRGRQSDFDERFDRALKGIS
jgi:Helix-turn-helix domain